MLTKFGVHLQIINRFGSTPEMGCEPNLYHLRLEAEGAREGDLAREGALLQSIAWLERIAEQKIAKRWIDSLDDVFCDCILPFFFHDRLSCEGMNTKSVGISVTSSFAVFISWYFQLPPRRRLLDISFGNYEGYSLIWSMLKPPLSFSIVDSLTALGAAHEMARDEGTAKNQNITSFAK